MQTSLADLIDRMANKEPSVSSDSSISWAAYRQAEKLDDAALIDDLVTIATSDKAKARRSAACFVIGKIGSNIQNQRCARLLLDLLKTERDKHNIANILERVGEIEKPAGFDLTAIYDLLKDSRWIVRHAAIRALSMARDSEAELHLLGHLASIEDPYDQIYCHSILGQLGTARAIPQLEHNLKSRKRDVKLSADAALQTIRDRLAAV